MTDKPVDYTKFTVIGRSIADSLDGNMSMKMMKPQWELYTCYDISTEKKSDCNED